MFLAGLALAAPALAQSPATRQGLMDSPCAATAEALCRTESDEALAKGQTLQLVILRGCQAEFRVAAPQGADAIDAAKDRVTACLELAVRGGAALSSAAILEGHEDLRRIPKFAMQTDSQFVATVRARLSAADTRCSRIKHKYTRYNCFTKALQTLYEAH